MLSLSAGAAGAAGAGHLPWNTAGAAGSGYLPWNTAGAAGSASLAGSAGSAGSASLAGSTGMAGSGNLPPGCDGFVLLQYGCGVGGGACHGGPNIPSAQLSNFAVNLDTMRYFVDQPSTFCAGSDDASVFNPRDPSASLVIRKLRGTSSCGQSMPLSADRWSEADIACVESWIGSL
jgi:hypothetical protein